MDAGLASIISVVDVPSGIIVLWSGAIVNIPAGWVICDGINSTPDLRDKFIVGAGTTYNPADTGGAVNHNHTGTAEIVNSSLDTGDKIIDSTATGDFENTLTDDTITVVIDNAEGLPPYYALAYIMKT